MQEVVQIGIKILLNPDGSQKCSLPILIKATPELKAREAKIIAREEEITASYLQKYLEILDEIEKERKERKLRDAERKQIINRIMAGL